MLKMKETYELGGIENKTETLCLSTKQNQFVIVKVHPRQHYSTLYKRKQENVYYF